MLGNLFRQYMLFYYYDLATIIRAYTSGSTYIGSTFVGSYLWLQCCVNGL